MQTELVVNDVIQNKVIPTINDEKDKHKRQTHTIEMKNCSHLIRGKKICKNRYYLLTIGV